MPFTINPAAYQGGNFIFQGLSNLGKGVGDAIEAAQNQNKMESYNDSIVQHAYQNGQITLEDLTKYRQMSHTSKTGYAAGLAANFAEDMKREQLAAAREERQAQAQLHQQQAAAFNFQPSDEQKALARATGNELIQTGPGKWTATPYDAGNGQDAVVTDPLTINGQTIPGIGVNRKTGQYVYFGGLAGGGIDNTAIDPVTHAPFYRDPKGNKHFLTGQQVMAGQMMPQPDTTATPPPAGGMTMQDIWNAIGSIGATSPADVPGAAAPSAAATPADVPPVAAAAAAATGADITPKRLDPATAKQFLLQAGGDKEKARALAKAAGYVF
jgi:hypothetical protein